MRKRLKLFLWEDCNRKCPNCPTDNIPEEEINFKGLANYDDIVLTGGEPMLKPERVHNLIMRIRIHYPEKRIYLHTADTRDRNYIRIMMFDLDGITVTIHSQFDVDNFNNFSNSTVESLKERVSCRLNLAPGVRLNNLYAQKHWKTKVIGRRPYCPTNELCEDSKRWVD